MIPLLKLVDGLIEPVPIEDTFCPFVAGIESVGPLHPIVFATTDTNLSIHSGDYVAVEKLALTDESLAALADAIPKYLEHRERESAVRTPQQQSQPLNGGNPKLKLVEPAQDEADSLELN